MRLQDSMEASGSWLFRWRSVVPLAPLALLLVGAHAASAVPARATAAWGLLCLLISLAGLVLRGWVVGSTPARTSGRNRKAQVADSLNTTGAYSVVRHPLYLGNFLMWTGIALLPGVWWAAVAALLVFALVYERIMLTEERFLLGRFGARFEAWADSTPAIVPRLDGWRPSEVPFCWRTAVRRECSGMFGMVAAFASVDAVREHRVHGMWVPSNEWIVLFATGLTFYLVLRSLKTHTRILNVRGRS